MEKPYSRKGPDTRVGKVEHLPVFSVLFRTFVVGRSKAWQFTLERNPREHYHVYLPLVHIGPDPFGPPCDRSEPDLNEVDEDRAGADGTSIDVLLRE